MDKTKLRQQALFIRTSLFDEVFNFPFLFLLYIYLLFFLLSLSVSSLNLGIYKVNNYIFQEIINKSILIKDNTIL